MSYWCGRDDLGGSMIEREYRAWCIIGQHGSYVRLRTAEPQRFARCPICGDEAVLTVVLPIMPHDYPIPPDVAAQVTRP